MIDHPAQLEIIGRICNARFFDTIFLEFCSVQPSLQGFNRAINKHTASHNSKNPAPQSKPDPISTVFFDFCEDGPVLKEASSCTTQKKLPRQKYFSVFFHILPALRTPAPWFARSANSYSIFCRFSKSYHGTNPRYPINSSFESWNPTSIQSTGYSVGISRQNTL